MEENRSPFAPGLTESIGVDKAGGPTGEEIRELEEEFREADEIYEAEMQFQNSFFWKFMTFWETPFFKKIIRNLSIAFVSLVTIITLFFSILVLSGTLNFSVFENKAVYEITTWGGVIFIAACYAKSLFGISFPKQWTFHDKKGYLIDNMLWVVFIFRVVVLGVLFAISFAYSQNLEIQNYVDIHSEMLRAGISVSMAWFMAVNFIVVVSQLYRLWRKENKLSAAFSVAIVNILIADAMAERVQTNYMFVFFSSSLLLSTLVLCFIHVYFYVAVFIVVKHLNSFLNHCIDKKYGIDEDDEDPDEDFWEKADETDR